MAETKTMKAVVFDGPRKVSVVDRPIPQREIDSGPYHQQSAVSVLTEVVVQSDGRDDASIIVKVHVTALCGSELHVFRGHQKSETGFIMGHEFTGAVVQVGSAVRSVQVGDNVVSPFTVSCMQCFYCKNGHSSRCTNSLLFGSTSLDGGQAEYVKVPFADGTVMKAPPEIDEKVLILMADIFPTGFFGAKNAFQMLNQHERVEPCIVVVGCGPVGLCAVIAALDHKPKHLFAVDSVEERLELARKLGAEPLNFMKDKDGMMKRIKEVTQGRGADAVIEVVGLSPALRTAFDLVRPWGVISSIGVHNGEIPWTGSDAYNKNLRIQMGRCPVRSIFPEALELLARKQNLLGFMFDKMMPLSEAVEGYDLFDKMKAQKVIFTP